MITKESFAPKLKEKHNTLWQLIVFLLMGGFTSIVDLGSFALFNYWIFAGLKTRAVSWWLFDYGVENGGMCALLSLAFSFAISQTFNFFVQRKVTFAATGNVLYSAVMYAVMVIGVYFLILWLPTLYMEPVCRLLGDTWGSLLVKLSTQTISAIIQFPMSKWVIMRGDGK